MDFMEDKPNFDFDVEAQIELTKIAYHELKMTSPNHFLLGLVERFGDRAIIYRPEYAKRYSVESIESGWLGVVEYTDDLIRAALGELVKRRDASE
jgi:hypothetical protein